MWFWIVVTLIAAPLIASMAIGFLLLALAHVSNQERENTDALDLTRRLQPHQEGIDSGPPGPMGEDR
jgi:hypothetical protein